MLGGLKTFKLALQLLSSIAGYMRDKRMMEAGAAKIIIDSLERASDETDKAIKSGVVAGKRFDDLDGLPDNQDPNLRD